MTPRDNDPPAPKHAPGILALLDKPEAERVLIRERQEALTVGLQNRTVSNL